LTHSLLLLAAEPSEPAGTAWSILLSGGLTGIAILFLLAIASVIALTLAVEHLLTTGRSTLMPQGLAQQVRQQLTHDQLTARQLAAAVKHCEQTPSALAAVLSAGLRETPGSWPAVEKGMEEALAQQAARLLRKIDSLSVIGNIAPMLGLLGTVFGMIFAFQEVANTQGAARAAELASGIYQALVTTVGGLSVAIPSLTAFAVFRNRIDALIAETGSQAQTAIAPLKRAFQMGTFPMATEICTPPPPLPAPPSPGAR